MNTVLIVLGVWLLLLIAFVAIMAHYKRVPYPKPPPKRQPPSRTRSFAS